MTKLSPEAQAKMEELAEEYTIAIYGAPAENEDEKMFYSEGFEAGYAFAREEERERAQKLVEALRSIIKTHENIKEAQSKHYFQNWYEDMKRDGLKYDVSVAATFPIFDCAIKALDQYLKESDS